ncbi:4'-phosphopantetheinyl transferase superfamily protein [Streptomyces phaeolivaceus]|uniref:4'-phosphopantetheinyl transferase superfamily protein n=1 Tax=Streptomyces phaeolivaceus TaxID=2653200 RepID=A0A5P8K7T3_9ACTN|nr:4'-phosphopantetheinyl transferase superfamily protein [Streptomyces phaeolivaceus]QFQ99383.1 4'-phosphopantetheinyl transferase superfamily protein [Streptomyces phaeolivaceus]
MLSRIVPAGIAVAESFGDDPEAVLLPEEEEHATAMSDARRDEFATGRHQARRAALCLGIPPAPLLPGAKGAPVWPDGVIGSITHCRGYRAAAVGLSQRTRALGIDAEPDLPMTDGMLEAIALPEEREQNGALRRLHAGVSWDRLLFCAKEVVYKVWSPLTGTWLGFDEAVITIAPGGTFRARILKAAPEGDVPTTLDGRWTADRGLLLAATHVPQDWRMAHR